jgi:hypothetical protein
VIDTVTGQMTLFIEPTDTPSPEPGVPYWLQGEELLEWVCAETASPSKEMPPSGRG